MTPWLVLLVVVVGASAARADDVRPVSFEIIEVANDRFDVRFQTPMRGERRLRVRPNLPEGSTLIEGTYERTVRGDSAIETFTFERPEGLVGEEVGVDGLALGVRGAVLQIKLRDGRTLRAVLGSSRPAYHVEPAPEETRPPWTATGEAAARAGLRHGLLENAHLLLAVALVLALGAGGAIRALALFLAGSLAGVGLAPLLPPALVPAPGLVEAIVALAACFAARGALRGTTAGLGTLSLAAGLLHGSGTQALGLTPLEGAAHAFGLDLAHLALGGLALLGWRVLRRPAAHRAAAWGVGVLGIAIAVVATVRPDSEAAAPTPAGILPMILSSAPATPSPRPPGLQTDMEAYLDIGVFDTRIEILARLSTLEGWLDLPIPTAPTLPVSDQEPLLARIADGILERLTITVDGRSAQPDSVRRAFATQDAQGTWLREEAVPEERSTALIGVVYALARPTIPEDVEVAYQSLPEGLGRVRARIIDPETSREVELLAADPRLRWTNDLTSAPLPDADVVRVGQRPVPVPLLSLALLGVSAVLAFFAMRRRRGTRAILALRLGVALALLVLSIATVDISEQVGETAAPTPREARTITSALLENLYLAFNVREEEAVYDRLAFSLTEASRTDAYVQNRRSLTYARVGGARTHVDVVELRSLDDIESARDGGFRTLATWTVAGSVTHFGHRHLRLNLYRARLRVVPVDRTWKIDTFEIEDIARER